MFYFLQRLIPEPLRGSRKWQLIWLAAMLAVLAFVATQIYALSVKCVSGEPVTTIKVSDSNRLPNISILVRHTVVKHHLQLQDFSTNVTWKGINWKENVTQPLSPDSLKYAYENTFVTNPASCRVASRYTGVVGYSPPEEDWNTQYSKLLEERGGALNLFKSLLPPPDYFVEKAKFEMNQRADVVMEGYGDCVGLCYTPGNSKGYVYPTISVSSHMDELGVAYTLNTSVMPMDKNTDIVVNLRNLAPTDNDTKPVQFHVSAGSASQMLDFLGIGLDPLYEYTIAMSVRKYKREKRYCNPKLTNSKLGCVSQCLVDRARNNPERCLVWIGDTGPIDGVEPCVGIPENVWRFGTVHGKTDKWTKKCVSEDTAECVAECHRVNNDPSALELCDETVVAMTIMKQRPIEKETSSFYVMPDARIRFVMQDANVQVVELKDGYTFPQYFADIGGLLGVSKYGVAVVVIFKSVWHFVEEKLGLEPKTEDVEEKKDADGDDKKPTATTL